MSKTPDRGLDLVEAIRAGLPPGVELDEREEALLDLAARQAVDVAARVPPQQRRPGQRGDRPIRRGSSPADRRLDTRLIAFCHHRPRTRDGKRRP
jgi:hypothetical protein